MFKTSLDNLIDTLKEARFDLISQLTKRMDMQQACAHMTIMRIDQTLAGLGQHEVIVVDQPLMRWALRNLPINEFALLNDLAQHLSVDGGPAKVGIPVRLFDDMLTALAPRTCGTDEYTQLRALLDAVKARNLDEQSAAEDRIHEAIMDVLDKMVWTAGASVQNKSLLAHRLFETLKKIN